MSNLGLVGITRLIENEVYHQLTITVLCEKIKIMRML
jgi:hypothetical protein